MSELKDDLKVLQGKYNQLATHLVASSRLIQRAKQEIEAVHQEMDRLEQQMGLLQKSQQPQSAASGPTLVKS